MVSIKAASYSYMQVQVCHTSLVVIPIQELHKPHTKVRPGLDMHTASVIEHNPLF